jgi:hypothetical protein
VLSNLDLLTENTLAYFINSNLCQNAKLALSSKNIHIYIVDLDRAYDSEIIKKAELLKQYIIGIYINKKIDNKNDRLILVKKPLNVSELKNAIDKAHNKIFKIIQKPPTDTTLGTKNKTKFKHKDQTHRNLYNAIDDENIEDDIHLRYKAQRYVGNNKDVNPKHDDLDKIYFKADTYLYFHLINAMIKAKAKKSNAMIKSSLGNINYNYQDNSLSHNIDKNKLKLLQTTPLISSVRIEISSSIKTQNENFTNATNFVWDACIRTSKGRLPESTSLIKPVTMSIWPNFSQLKIFRHAIPIAAVWSRQRISLIETANLLKIPQRYVFSLYTAMNALGYTEILNNQENSVQTSIQNKNEQSKPSKLFSRILSHIFKRN